MALVTALAPAACAQSLLETLFGFGAPAPRQSVPPQRLGVPALPPAAAGRRDEPASLKLATRERNGADDGAKYQTMCVRTCDGYYWPIRYPASRRDFKTDEAMCRSACGSQTQLYYRPGPGTDAEEMRDLDGRSYGASETAFAYRRGLVNGCACRPMPWSDGERARHEGYALAEQEKALRVTQAEAEKAAAAAEAEAARSRPKPSDPEIAATRPTSTGDGLRIGPAEARVMADLAGAPGADYDEATPARASAEAPAEPAARKSRPRRIAGDGQVRPAASKTERLDRAPARVRTAAAKPQQGLAWLGGGGKYTYPGDQPSRR